jgi:hypothetical protein
MLRIKAYTAMAFHFYMEAKFGSLEKGVKTIDINLDEIFQNNSRVRPFLLQKECRNFGRVENRTR